MKFCPQCGTSITAQGRFCVECGASLSEGSAPSPSPAASKMGTTSNSRHEEPASFAAGMNAWEAQPAYASEGMKQRIAEPPATTDSELVFVGKNAEFYQLEWNKIRSGSKISFNLWAGLLGPLWLVYRKMYLYAGAVVGLFLLQGFGEIAMGEISPIAGAIENVFFMAIFGLFGNNMYLHFAQGKIREICATTTNARSDLAKAGGVNPWAPWALLAIFFAWGILMVRMLPD